MPVPIDAADDPRLADYQGLRSREQAAGVVIAESEAVVTRLVASPLRVRSFLLSPSRYERMRAVVEPVGAPVYVAEREVMSRIVGYDIHRGVLAAADRPAALLLTDVLATARRLVVLEGSNDHENIGAVARSARGLGFDAMVLDPTCADPYYRRSVRVSMGEILHLPVVRCGAWPAPLGQLAAAGFTVWALTPSPDAADLFTVPVPAKVALLAGAEGPGLSAGALATATTAVRIPMQQGVDSLNLGHALAIAMARVAGAAST